MVRKLSLAIALALGVTPFAANALGLGDIQSKSALNQQFSANIQLLSVTDEEIEDIRAALASAEVFRKSGMERPYFLSNLKFTPMRLPDGSGVIQITSSDPIREPFINFVVEVNWPKGRLFREYTVLLDPPVTLERAPAPVQRATTARRAPVTRQSPVQGSPSTAVTAPVVSGTTDGAGSEYGPTQKNDTLWGIAKQVRHNGVTMEQMVMSLFQANPQAFINGNVNNLKVGQILRVPDREDALSMAAGAARTAFRDQMSDWRADRQPKAAEPQEVVSELPASEQTAVVDSVAEQVTPEAELKIAELPKGDEGAEGMGQGSDATSPAEQLEADLMAAREVRESALAEGRELKSKIGSLESQLEDLQRLLVLKDEQLARLQRTLGMEPEGVASGSVTGQTAGEPEEELVADAASGLIDEASPVVDQPEGSSDAEESPVAGIEGVEIAGLAPEMEQVESDIATETESAPVEAAVESPVEPATLASAESTPQPEPVLVVPPQVEQERQLASEPAAVKPEQPAVKPPVKEAPVEPVSVARPKEPDLLQKLIADPTMLAVAGGSLVVLLALLWIVISRRRAANEEFQESILVDTIRDADQDEGAQASDASEAISQEVDETSFLSDFSPSDIDVLQDETGEVDPLSEADVYIAYGRYGQAEELIRQALQRDPERQELKRKLFDILYSTRNAAAFTSLAEESAAAGMPKSDKVGWEAVVSMGTELVPGNKLFQDQAPATTVQEQEVDDLQKELADVADLDLGDIADDLELDGELKASLDDLDSIDLEDLGIDEGKVVNADSALDLDIGLELNQGLDSSDEPERLSLDDLQDDASDPVHDKAADANEGGEPVGVVNLQGHASQLEDTVIDFTAAGSANARKTPQQAGDEHLSLDVEGGGKLELPDEGEPLAFGLPDQDEFVADEVNTKLDLAKAYVDMGDAEGARSILDEVINEGNDQQKQTAKKMLGGFS